MQIAVHSSYIQKDCPIKKNTDRRLCNRVNSIHNEASGRIHVCCLSRVAIKNGQTTPVYPVMMNRAFERMKLIVQSTDP